MLLQVTGALQAKGMPQHVVSVTERGRYADELEARGVPVIALGVNSVFSGLRGLLRLARLIGQLQPQVVQGWMYHGDLMALFAHYLARDRGVLFQEFRQALVQERLDGTLHVRI